MVIQAGAKLAGFAPETIELARRAAELFSGRTKILEEAIGIGPNVISTEALEKGLQTLFDNGLSQSVENARQELPDYLNRLVGSVNGQLGEKKQLLQDIARLVHDGAELDAEQTRDLKGIFDYIIADGEVDPTEDVQKDHTEKVNKKATEGTEQIKDQSAPEKHDTNENSYVTISTEVGPLVISRKEYERHMQNGTLDDIKAAFVEGKKKAQGNNEEEIEKRVNEKLAQAGLTGDGIPKHWADKVLKGVSGILVGEVKNLNSPLGWAIKLYGKITGKEFSKESVNQFLGKFVDDNFKGKLEKLVEAKVLGKGVPESVFNGLTDKEKIGVEWVGKITHWGSKTPKFIFDAIAATGVMIDASAEMLHNVPILGRILKIPLVRMAYTNLASFFGRFSQDIDLISKGTQQLKDIVKLKSQRVEPTAQTPGSK